MEEIITNNSQETQKAGETFVKRIFPLSLTEPIILALYGNLGAGKTTFVQGLAKGLGIEKRIISPTFVIIRSYDVPFYHVDLYRLENESQIENTGLLEILKKPNAIIAIEWPEKMGSLLPKKRLDVRFEYLEEEKRKITITNS